MGLGGLLPSKVLGSTPPRCSPGAATCSCAELLCLSFGICSAVRVAWLHLFPGITLCLVSALATLVIICSLLSWCCKKKETELNTLTKGVTWSLPQQAYCDMMQQLVVEDRIVVLVVEDAAVVEVKSSYASTVLETVMYSLLDLPHPSCLSSVFIESSDFSYAPNAMFGTSGDRKKKQGTFPTGTWNVTAPPPQKTYRDIERGEKVKSSGAKDGGMVVLGAGAAIAATAVAAAGGTVMGIVA
ncbi:hypothetical protein Acr_12g0002870 [Actinidia rufa]|uniref:Transmembrane protein n=1 Tax=Actinidia rufa TaxID=165716 RepID=A0A7J0FH32_9ERIC|nr:hypothetical protein Acr_12g0002870 [Actinidia rufa]